MFGHEKRSFGKHFLLFLTKVSKYKLKTFMSIRKRPLDKRMCMKNSVFQKTLQRLRVGV